MDDRRAMVGVAAAVASSEHACALVRAHGVAGWTGRLVPLTVDGFDLCEFDGDARLGALEGAGARQDQPRPGNPAP